MKVTKEFIELGMNNDNLSQAQCEILNVSYPFDNNISQIKELTNKEINLFLLLKGKLSKTAEKTIIKNYQTLSDFHAKKSPKISKLKQKKRNISSIIEIYCDGACKGNPGKSGSGLAIYEKKDKPILLFGDFNNYGTNNTAELNALYKALLISKDYTKSIIKTDSKYSIDSITKWAYNWKKANWTKKGGEIKNLEIIKKSHNLYEEIKKNVSIEYVKGHAGIEGNELADRMAGVSIIKRNKEYEIYRYNDVNRVLCL